MNNFVTQLSGGDRRSIGKSNLIASRIKNREDFDSLWTCLYHPDKIVAMRAADCVEKVTSRRPDYLREREEELLRLSRCARDKEMIWHLAQLLPRLRLHESQREEAWDILQQWACDQTQSRIVRVSALQALWDISAEYQWRADELGRCMRQLKSESVPSIVARIRLLEQGSR